MKIITPHQTGTDHMSDRHYIDMAHRYLKESNAYGPGGNAKGEPGHVAKTRSILRAIEQGIEDRAWDEAETQYRLGMGQVPNGSEHLDSTARAIVKALAEVGFRITKAPAKK